MSTSTTGRGRELVCRLGLIGLTVLVSSAVGTGSAAAAPAGLVLDPDEVSLYFDNVENFGGPNNSPTARTETVPLPIAWDGEVDLQLPVGVVGDDMVIELDLVPDPSHWYPTRSLSSEGTGADRLAVSPLGSGRYRIDMPTEDLGNGPFARLAVSGLAHVDGVAVAHSPLYLLRFDGAGPTSLPLVPKMNVYGSLDCLFAATVGCPDTVLSAGDSITVTVPASSELQTLGHGDLRDAEVSLGDAKGDWPERLILSGDPGRYTVGEPWTATVTLPGDLPADVYALDFSLGDLDPSVPNVLVTVFLRVEAAAPPPSAVGPVGSPATPPAPSAQAAVNPGLRSSTGVAAPAGDSRSGAVATGAGLLLLAAAGGVALARPRRRDLT